MLTVSGEPGAVELQLSAGVLSCPGCAGRVGPWGSARRRPVRGGDRVRMVTPRRGRCRGCRVTHVLLPVTLLLRRFDVVAVIGRAVELAAVGIAGRAIVRRLGLPRSTVRGWLARFAGRVQRLRAHFTAWAVWLAPGWSGPAPAGSSIADAVAVIVVAAHAAAEDVWTFASAVTGGRLLCNTSAPFPAPWTR